MLELTIAFAIMAAVGSIGVLAAVLTPHLVTALGLGTLGLGLLVGVPTGFWYHVVLYRVVSARGPLPARWWLSPSALHAPLTDAELGRILRWYRAGGIGFILSVAGGLVAIAGLLIAGG